MLELQPVVFGKRLSCICTTQMQDYQKKEIVIMPFVNFCFKWLCSEFVFSFVLREHFLETKCFSLLL